MDLELEEKTETIVEDKESNLFDPELITFIDEPKSRDHVLRALTDLLKENEKIDDAEAFYEAIIKRESIVSTGIGLGIAIPHAKLEGFDDFFVAVAILPRTGVDWDAIDGAPVRVVFLIGGPSDKQNDYLHILSSITQRMRKDDIRARLLLSRSPQSAIEQLC